MGGDPVLQVAVALTEAVIPAYVDRISLQQHRERNGLLSQQGGVKGRLWHSQAGRGLWACYPL